MLCESTWPFWSHVLGYIVSKQWHNYAAQLGHTHNYPCTNGIATQIFMISSNKSNSGGDCALMEVALLTEALILMSEWLSSEREIKSVTVVNACGVINGRDDSMLMAIGSRPQTALVRWRYDVCDAVPSSYHRRTFADNHCTKDYSLRTNRARAIL